MRAKQVERCLMAIQTILTNYAAIAFGIGVFEHSAMGMISGVVTCVCAIYVAFLNED